jgi:hypothetical protein
MRDKTTKVINGPLAEVLPHSDKPWYRIPHLLRLNLLLLIPLMSSAVAGYDGNISHSLHDMRYLTC